MAKTESKEPEPRFQSFFLVRISLLWCWNRWKTDPLSVIGSGSNQASEPRCGTAVRKWVPHLFESWLTSFTARSVGWPCCFIRKRCDVCFKRRVLKARRICVLFLLVGESELRIGFHERAKGAEGLALDLNHFVITLVRRKLSIHLSLMQVFAIDSWWKDISGKNYKVPWNKSGVPEPSYFACSALCAPSTERTALSVRNHSPSR